MIKGVHFVDGIPLSFDILCKFPQALKSFFSVLTALNERKIEDLELLQDVDQFLWILEEVIQTLKRQNVSIINGLKQKVMYF